MIWARVIAIIGSLLLAVMAPGCNDSGAPSTPLTVTGVSPASGPLAGGTSVTITGTNFTDVTSVTIGGSELGSRTVVGTTQITGTTPGSTSSGPKDVVVTSSESSDTCSGCFSYMSEGGVVATTIAAGDFHTCALTSSGGAYCWGANGIGQLGNGSNSADSYVPVAVTGGLTFGSIATGYGHTCGLTTSGAAYCWGLNDRGQLGNSSFTNSLTPAAVSEDLSFSVLAPANGIGSPFTCGLTSSGAAYCWGASGVGGLGTGSTMQSSIPLAVLGGHTFSALDAGGGHGCGLLTSGAAYCWGLNNGGQLGDGSTTNTSAPIAVSGSQTFSGITANGGHTCGLTSSGAAYCWGYNYIGQLGDGSTTSSSTPVAVSGGLSFSSLRTGGSYTCGLTSSGAAYCWGANDDGQLGSGSTTSTSTPVAVSGGLSFSALTAGTRYTCGITSSGTAHCWGWNEFGQLGNGTTSSSAVPVPVAW